MSQHILTPSTSEEAHRLLGEPGLPLLVDFFAQWCGPCRAMAPALDAFAAKHAGKIRVVKLDVDKVRELAGQVGIRSVPTLLLVKDGQVLAARAGAMNEKDLERFALQQT